MPLSNLRKVKSATTLGIDCSTKSLAYALYKGKTPVHCGEVFFDGANLYERLADAHKKIPAMVASGLLKADYIAFEGAWLGPSPQTGLNLAYVYGAAIGALLDTGATVVTVQPLAWQNYIGNGPLKKHEKEQIKADFPDKSASWYTAKNRDFRKQRTLAFSKTMFDIKTDSDNIGDAVAIGYYAVHKLTTT